MLSHETPPMLDALEADVLAQLESMTTVGNGCICRPSTGGGGCDASCSGTTLAEPTGQTFSLLELPSTISDGDLFSEIVDSVRELKISETQSTAIGKSVQDEPRTEDQQVSVRIRQKTTESPRWEESIPVADFEDIDGGNIGRDELKEACAPADSAPLHTEATRAHLEADVMPSFGSAKRLNRPSNSPPFQPLASPGSERLTKSSPPPPPARHQSRLRSATLAERSEPAPAGTLRMQSPRRRLANTIMERNRGNCASTFHNGAAPHPPGTLSDLRRGGSLAAKEMAAPRMSPRTKRYFSPLSEDPEAEEEAEANECMAAYGLGVRQFYAPRMRESATKAQTFSEALSARAADRKSEEPIRSGRECGIYDDLVNFGKSIPMCDELNGTRPHGRARDAQKSVRLPSPSDAPSPSSSSTGAALRRSMSLMSSFSDASVSTGSVHSASSSHFAHAVRGAARGVGGRISDWMHTKVARRAKAAAPSVPLTGMNHVNSLEHKSEGADANKYRELIEVLQREESHLSAWAHKKAVGPERYKLRSSGSLKHSRNR